MNPSNGSDKTSSRRDFVKTTTAVAAVAAVAASCLRAAEPLLDVPKAVVTNASNRIKIGLIGVGGRGSGAAANACHADEGNVLWAVGDMFPDQIEEHLKPIQTELGSQVEVPKERQHTGWDAYKSVIDAVDVVLLATPPHFRPIHLEAVAKAGKHCFCEKPVGVDPVGVKKVMEVSKIFAENKKSLVSGLCYRYDEAKREVVGKIHAGAIGDIRILQHNYLTGGLWTRPRKPEWTDMEWQVRNWLYFYWLSGDHIVEQHIHSIDKMMWIMKDEPPVKVMATGGRIQRTAPQYGNVYDHFNTIFEWENGVRAFTNCRQFVECGTDVSDWAFGVDGIAAVGAEKPFITGKNPIKIKKSKQNMYDSEHVALFKSIRDNAPINNGDYMCKSTMCAIMARTSAYSGKEVTWLEMVGGTVIDENTGNEVKIPASTESFSPEKYGWGPREVDAVVAGGVAAIGGKAAPGGGAYVSTLLSMQSNEGGQRAAFITSVRLHLEFLEEKSGQVNDFRARKPSGRILFLRSCPASLNTSGAVRSR